MAPVSSQTVQTVYTTLVLSAGSTVQETITSSEVVAATSSTASSTSAAGLDSGNLNSGTTSLTTSQKSTIIGAVVGVGGAILLGALAFVAWRVWGRKKPAVEDDDDLIANHPGSSGNEKASTTGDSPFRSTLDQYHSPTAPVNAASNF